MSSRKIKKQKSKKSDMMSNDKKELAQVEKEMMKEKKAQ